MNHQFVYAQAILDFDQKLFLNEPLMCPFAERSCDEVPLSCDSCNWDQVSVSIFSLKSIQKAILFSDIL